MQVSWKLRKDDVIYLIHLTIARRKDASIMKIVEIVRVGEVRICDVDESEEIVIRANEEVR